MANDRYNSFAELKKCEKPDKDYRILISDVGSPITIIAPHGGKIEPNTSEIAKQIAVENYNYYCFEGIKKSNNDSLHITSHNFDEPTAIKIISKSDIVLAIHACTGTTGSVYIGGLDGELKKIVAVELESRGIRASIKNSRFKGLHPNNLCNRGATGKGVQLEITRDLRDAAETKRRIAQAVRASLEIVTKKRARNISTVAVETKYQQD